MNIDEKVVALDTDFIGHIVETRMEEDQIIYNLQLLFNEAELTPIVHPLVYDKEIKEVNVKFDFLFDRNIIQKVEFDEIFQGDDDKKEYYIFLIKEFFKYIFGQTFPKESCDVLTYWKSSSSLGEMHSLAMCTVCGCHLFLSDDKGSKDLKTYMKNKSINNEIKVYNREEFINEYGYNCLKRSVKKALTHVAR